MEEPAIKGRLKMIQLNTSVYEDVAGCLPVQEYVSYTHHCHINFKALRVPT